jgi:hypothetical protein
MALQLMAAYPAAVAVKLIVRTVIVLAVFVAFMSIPSTSGTPPAAPSPVQITV